MFKSTVTGSASTTAVVTIPGAAVLTQLSDDAVSPGLHTLRRLTPRQRDDGQLHRREDYGAGWKDLAFHRIDGVQQDGVNSVVLFLEATGPSSAGEMPMTYGFDSWSADR